MHEPGRGQRFPVAVNPVDPRIGGTPVVGPPVVPRSAPPHPGRVHTGGSAVEDVANGAVAILAVAAALVRYAAEVATRGRRSALPRLPFIGPRGPVLRRGPSRPGGRVLGPAVVPLPAGWPGCWGPGRPPRYGRWVWWRTSWYPTSPGRCSPASTSWPSSASSLTWTGWPPCWTWTPSWRGWTSTPCSTGWTWTRSPPGSTWTRSPPGST